MIVNMEHIRKIVRQREYRLSFHAELERDADQITIREIEEAIFSVGSKIIEDYPNDPRGHSCLVLGFTKDGRPVHMVCGLADPEILIIITVYRPDPQGWFDNQQRKE